jgi:hypothetical protein
MHRSGGGGPFGNDPLAGVLSDSEKRKLVAGLLGQAFVVAYNTVRHNRDGTERVADELVRRREIYGNEVVELLKSAKLEKPQIDVLEESTWPTI